MIKGILLFFIMCFAFLLPAQTTIFYEDFEDVTAMNEAGWTESIIANSTNWQFINGAVQTDALLSAFAGTKNASFYSDVRSSISMLITPSLDFSGYGTATMTFYHAQKNWLGDQDELRIYYKTSAAGSWTLIPGQEYLSDVSTWTLRTVELPNLSSDYYIAFEGTANYGYGVLIDELTISGESSASPTVSISSSTSLIESNLNGAVIDVLLENETFIDNVLENSNFELLNEPIGCTISNVTYLSSTSCSITLAFDGTDFINDINDFQVQISGIELSSGTLLSSNSLNITAENEPIATISSASQLIESTLNGSVINLDLSYVEFVDNVIDPANINLFNAPTGCTVGSADWVSSTSCNITLSFDGTDFGVDVSNFYLEINASELTSNLNLPSNMLSIMAEGTKTHREILVEIYQALDGDNWKNTLSGTQIWDINNTSADISTWYGVKVSATTGNVISLSLPNNDLVGTLPLSIGGLTSLNTLDLSGNMINGSIPDGVWGITNLRKLYLEGNAFTGYIPSYIDQLQFLETITLGGANTNLSASSGNILEDLSSIASLDTLILSNCGFSGNIPASIGNLSILKVLDLSNNQFDGTIPVEICSLNNINVINLSFNKLTGQIPNDIGNLSNLIELNLRKNHLSGVIPAGIYSLTNLEVLDLAGDPEYTGTKLFGNIPDDIANLTKLASLSLASNQLTGISESLWNINSLIQLRLHNNLISSKIGAGLTNMTLLEVLSIHNNQFYGTMPADISGLTSLNLFNLENNNLEGLSVLPSNLSAGSISLANNKFTFQDLTNYSSWFTQQSQYAPQKEYELTNYNVGFCDGASLYIAIGDYSIRNLGTGCNYSWNFNGSDDFIQGSIVDVPTATSGYVGDYICKVTHPSLPGLILTHLPIDVYIFSNVIGQPDAITGSDKVCNTSTNVEYSVPEVLNADTYTWTIPSGASIISTNTTSNTILLNFNSTSAISGNISVTPSNTCGAVGTTSELFPVEIQSVIPSGIPSITGDVLACGVEEAYSVQGVTDQDSFSWTLPTGATFSSGEGTDMVTIDFTNSIDGTISVVGVNACGQTAPGSISITVGEAPDTPGGVTGEQEVCENQQNVTYSTPDIANAISYQWKVPEGAQIISGSSTNNIIVNFPSGNVSGSVSVSGVNTCGSGQAAILPVRVNGPVAAAGKITGNLELCPNTDETYNIATINGATSYIWSIPEGGSFITNNSTENVTLSLSSSSSGGDVTVFGRNSCFDGASNTLTIGVKPLADDAGAITGEAQVCTGTLAVYSTTIINNASSYQWTIPAGASISNGSGTNSVTIQFGSNSGTENISVQGVNECGINGNNSSIPVLIKNAPTTPGSITGDATVCGGNEIYSVVSDPDATSYVWTTNTGGTINGTSNEVTISFGSTVNDGVISVAARNECGTSTSSVLNITGSSLSAPELRVKWNSLLICINANGEYSQFEWRKIGDQTVLSTEPYLDTKGFGSGNYNVTVFNSEGCSRTSNNRSVKIGGLTSIYPNPSSEISVLKIINDFSGVFKVSIIDSESKAIKVLEFVKSTEIQEFDLPVSELKAGIYQVMISTEKELIGSKKLIIVK